VGLPGCGCPASCPLWCRLHHLPALPLRGRQALRHGAHLSDSSGSDSPGRALDQSVRSVGRSAGGGGWVVSRGGVGVSGSLPLAGPVQSLEFPCCECASGWSPVVIKSPEHPTPTRLQPLEKGWNNGWNTPPKRRRAQVYGNPRNLHARPLLHHDGGEDRGVAQEARRQGGAW